MYDFLIVGAGFFGATFARIATDAGKKCLIIEKNDFVGGTAADQKINGINVGLYGAHILHTNNQSIWEFMTRFTEIDPFINKPKVISQNKVYSFPINLMTLQQLWGVVTPEDARRKLQEVCIPCKYPRNFEEWALSKVGQEIYELFFYGYTKKQWMREPSELPASIIQRLPIRLTYNENYFSTYYQGMPKHGYTNFLNNLLDGIEVRLETDFFKLRDSWQEIARHLVYSGPIDQFFDSCFGDLSYNTLWFEHKILTGDYQGNAVMNHADLTTPYLRSVEHRHFYELDQKHYGEQSAEPTVITFDFPIAYSEHPEPYYPIRDDKNSLLYDQYSALKKNLPKITFGGRLGEYKYLDIDQTIASAIQKANKCLNIL